MWISPPELKADKVYNINGVTINECLLANHNVNNIDNPSKRTHKFKGVVIHNTPRAQSEDDGRQYTAATLNGNMATRTHYYVTELGAWRNLPDEYMNWSCGDGVVGDGNNGCISLEIIMSSRNNPKDLKARDNGAKIAAYILFKNNMTVNDMYTHNYFLNIRNGVTGDYNKLCTSPTPTRNCPYYIVWDWENFRKQVDEYIKKLGGKSIYGGATTHPTTDTTTKHYVYRAISQAAIRTGMSKNSTILGRVTKGKYYLSDKTYDNWFKHYGVDNYSMINDNGLLFESCEYEIKTAITAVNVRSTPGLKGKKISRINENEKVFVIKNETVFVDGYTWNLVIINNGIAYVAGEYLK